jgi:hypothetical protein
MVAGASALIFRTGIAFGSGSTIRTPPFHRRRTSRIDLDCGTRDGFLVIEIRISTGTS